MIECSAFLKALQNEGVGFYSGVPDSLFKSFCSYVADHIADSNHVIAANEGAAVAIATGAYLATNRIPLVYLQNSGIGNMINPLTSLVDTDVYSIPMIILIGWRGEPGVPDEPQHRKQGRVMTSLLDSLEIPYKILSTESETAADIVKEAVRTARSNGGPYVLIARKETFGPYKFQRITPDLHLMTREEAIKIIASSLPVTAAVVSTTGMTSRELFECREASYSGHERDFLTVGSMGHASQIAYGIALMKPKTPIYCIDGDGAALMHLGSLGIIGTSQTVNLKHILINNGAHDSVGGQPTVGFSVDFSAIARACGYRWTASSDDHDRIRALLSELENIDGPALLEIRVNKGARKDLGRPTISTWDNKTAFMNFLAQ